MGVAVDNKKAAEEKPKQEETKPKDNVAETTAGKEMVGADLSGPEEERETDDRMESAAIVAEDKGAYPADREGRTR